MEVLLAGAGLTVALLTIGVAALALVAPVFWVWMLIDALLRDDRDYPGGAPNSRLLWVLLIAFVQVSCVLYYFLVYAPARRGETGPNTSGGAAATN